MTTLASSTDLERIMEIVKATIRGGKTPQEAYSMLESIIHPDLLEITFSTLKRESKRIRDQESPGTISDPSFESWYLGPQASDKFWHSYKKHLIHKGWPVEVIDDIDCSSTKIISLLEHPGTAKISTRGLVLGHVQSGKTANYTAVIAKAADVGYRFIIVLSGLTNILREQTQLRIDEDLVSGNPEHWITVTDINDDFATNMNVNSFLTEKNNTKVLGVLKKNSSRLTKLNEWLEKARPDVLRACPILIIDDEADQASPNAHSNPEERTKINELIVNLLLLLPKAAYIGYTATPFANLFIDPTVPEDLYPRNFIVDLPRGKGYFGTEQIFGRAPIDENEEPVDGLDVIRIVENDEIQLLKPRSRDSRHLFQPQITPSLRASILYFWMAVTAKNLRGQENKHSTMLIHTTQYSDVQISTKPVIENFKNEILISLENKNQLLINELDAIWEYEHGRVPRSFDPDHPIQFSNILEHIESSIIKTEIKVENGISPSDDRVDFSKDESGNGRIAIVIGGNILSRGLTVEGLTVSFYIRSASAYDTLLQMGRWFGYREGYSDLMRIWMTEELKDYFYDLASVEYEIRQDISYYKNSSVTPMDFSVRIRQHPALSITAKLKMQHAVKAQMAFNGREVQTIVFKHMNSEWLLENISTTKQLICELYSKNIFPKTMSDRPHKIFTDVAANHVISFLDSYNIDDCNSEMPSDLLIKYIKAQNKKGNILNWNIGIITRSLDPILGEIELGLDEPIPLINRTKFSRTRKPDVVDIKALMSQTDLAADTPICSEILRGKDRNELRQLREEYCNNKGLLLIYPISKNSYPLQKSSKRQNLNAKDHILGLALVFPNVDKNSDLTPQDYYTVDFGDDESDYFDVEDIILS